ncbi:uncharacterized protein LOC131614405 [Vicia villosa]|uniref:uncharacterized protein LOC131614405 n=1 Tax=Vicia villosa TaxID=3911 RepID=UPI00273A958E|nr:uncharacterized protein LOC131614405 [Vicia villosa]
MTSVLGMPKKVTGAIQLRWSCALTLLLQINDVAQAVESQAGHQQRRGLIPSDVSPWFILRNGFNIPFWDVKWLDGMVLKEEFLCLYEASRLKTVSVAAMRGWVDNKWIWWDCGILGNRLYRTPFGPNGRHFEVKNLVWKSVVPFKVKAFWWRLLANRLPTKDLLVLRGIPLSFDMVLCSFCKIDPENQDHSFFGCSFVKNIWRDIAVWIGKDGIGEEESFSSFMDWHSFCKSKKVLVKKVDIIWLATTWSLWLSRNVVCFWEEVWNLDDLIWNIKVLVWRWSFCGENTHSNYSFYDFVKDPIRFLS